MKFSTAIIVSFLFLADFCAVQSTVLDISKFGGAPNSDITQVLIIPNEFTLRKQLFHLYKTKLLIYLMGMHEIDSML